jgi:hypothetical protein
VAKKCLRKPDEADTPSADGLLDAGEQGCAQPDLKYFTQSRK